MGAAFGRIVCKASQTHTHGWPGQKKWHCTAMIVNVRAGASPVPARMVGMGYACEPARTVVDLMNGPEQ